MKTVNTALVLMVLFSGFQAFAKDSAGATGKTAEAAKPATEKVKVGNSEITYRKDGANYVVIIPPGAKVMDSLLAFEAKENLPGANFNGIGAVENTEVSYYDMKKKAYQNKKFPASGEVVAFTGSMTYFDDKPAIHAHIALAGPDFKIYGGHFQNAEVSLVLEVFVYPTTAKINRATTEFPATKFIDLAK